eukprot:scpid98264/ scgid16283/ 
MQQSRIISRTPSSGPGTLEASYSCTRCEPEGDVSLKSDPRTAPSHSARQAYNASQLNRKQAAAKVLLTNCSIKHSAARADTARPGLDWALLLPASTQCCYAGKAPHYRYPY